MADNTTVLAHFYRASVMHADVWRRRLDATTNWAVVTTAAVITFAFGELQAPHFVLLMAILFAFFFLIMESRRYQVYHVWELRIRVLHHYLIAPALQGEEGADREVIQAGLAKLAEDLGSTIPRISVFQAAGYRIRRNYGPLITIVLLAWLLKLWLFPEPAGSFALMVERATVGIVPGFWVMVGTLLFFIGCVIAAVTAPSEHVVGWAEKSAPVKDVLHRRGRRGKR